MNKSLMAWCSIVIVLGGCASSGPIDQPATAAQIRGMSPLSRNIRVDDIIGGNRKNYLQMSGIDRKQFKQALTDALATPEWLANDRSAKYVLKTNLVEEGQPPSGVDITVTSVVRYTLVQVSDGSVFLDERISASGTDVDRTREVSERVGSAQTESAKNTIAQLIMKLKALQAKKDKILLPK